MPGSIPTGAEVGGAQSPAPAHADGIHASKSSNPLSPQANPDSLGPGNGSTGSDSGSRGNGTSNTAVRSVSHPAMQADPRAVAPTSSGNITDPVSNSALSAIRRLASPEPPNPAPPATPLLPPPSAALLLSPMTSPPSYPADPNLLLRNASSPAGADSGNASQPQPPQDPSASSPPAVYALPPSEALSALRGSNSSIKTPASDTDHANDPVADNNAAPDVPKTPTGHVLAPMPRLPNDTQSSSPEPALAAVKAFPPTLLPGALTPLPRAAGQLDSAPGQSPVAPEQAHAAPGQAPTASQQILADPKQSYHAQGPHLAAPVPLPGNAPSPLAGSPRTAPAPGDAQAQNTVVEETHTSHVPLIVLGTLLGAAVAALLAGTWFFFM